MSKSEKIEIAKPIKDQRDKIEDPKIKEAINKKLSYVNKPFSK